MVLVHSIDAFFMVISDNDVYYLENMSVNVDTIQSMMVYTVSSLYNKGNNIKTIKWDEATELIVANSRWRMDLAVDYYIRDNDSFSKKLVDIIKPDTTKSLEEYINKLRKIFDYRYYNQSSQQKI